MVAGTVATLALSVGAGILGLALQPDTYDGPTVMKAAVSGDSVWSMAQNVRSERPLEESVADIERLNDISGAIHPGQRVVVPVR
jgi:putative lysM domain protein